ncbi:hypothetical protein FP435_04720 [Lactobacillus sp. PV037]|uniref:hypothetical protein n=1 Tax=Lactobacillus sp. PV037 TaxID=2594496 RepID=UPI0022405835|nr:hypothetical protein [Lactobacillus sp. PV037]QNQ83794.1 hypothetical protein FP435_04720 [Lactobacillus sp. PV037]
MELSKQDQMVRRELASMSPETIKYIPYKFNDKYGALECRWINKDTIQLIAGTNLELMDPFNDSLEVIFDKKKGVFDDCGYTSYNLYCVGISIVVLDGKTWRSLVSTSLNDLILIINRLYGDETNAK